MLAPIPTRKKGSPPIALVTVRYACFCTAWRSPGELSINSWNLQASQPLVSLRSWLWQHWCTSPVTRVGGSIATNKSTWPFPTRRRASMAYNMRLCGTPCHRTAFLKNLQANGMLLPEEWSTRHTPPSGNTKGPRFLHSSLCSLWMSLHEVFMYHFHRRCFMPMTWWSLAKIE